MVMKRFSGLSITLILLISGCSTFKYQDRGPTSVATPTISELIPLFTSSDPNARVHAAALAGNYWDDPDKAILLPYLVDALSGPDYSDRGGRKEFAAQSIRELGLYDENAFVIFISWVNSNSGSSGELLQAIQAMEEFPNQAVDAQPGLIVLLENGDAHVIQAAIRLLSLIGKTYSIPAIMKIAISDNPPWIRRDALCIKRSKSNT
jgi:hypothetical protein